MGGPGFLGRRPDGGGLLPDMRDVRHVGCDHQDALRGRVVSWMWSRRHGGNRGRSEAATASRDPWKMGVFRAARRIFLSRPAIRAKCLADGVAEVSRVIA